MKNDIITLVSITTNGAEVKQENKDVFAEKKSLTRSEFYASYQVGLNPRYVFSVDLLDFESCGDVKKIVYREKEYNIIRTYETDIEIELTVG